MNRSKKLFWGKTVVIGAIPLMLWAYDDGAPAKSTGAPGENTCNQSSCHVGTAVNGGGGNVTVAFADGSTTYTPGVNKTVRVTVSDSSARVYGLQASPRLTGDTTKPAGKLVNTSGFVIICGNDAIRNGSCPTSNPLEFIDQSSPKSSGTFEFAWTPPAAGTGDVTFYVAGNAANGNGQNTGDHIYTTSSTFKEAAASGNKPAISDGGVVNAASSAGSITPGSWVSIYGSNLATATTTWDGLINNGNFPTSINGVSATINGKPAYINFVSVGQINVQAPDDTARGPVAVVVTNAAGQSNTTNVNLTDVAPGLFTYAAAGKKWASATLSSAQLYYGQAANLPGVKSQVAKPGNIVELWATGLGPTQTAKASGIIVSTASPTTNKVTVTIGGVDAPVAFSGIVGAGLYQVNVTIPNLSPGDYPVVATVNGITTQAEVWISVAN